MLVDDEVGSMIGAEELLQAIKNAPAYVNDLRAASELERTLIESFASLEEAERFDVVHNLTEVDNDAARKLLMEVLISDPSPLVRHEAAFALGYIGNQDVVPSLKQAVLRDDSFLVRHEAAMALADVGSEEDIPCLTAGLQDASREVAISCQVAVKRIRARHAAARTDHESSGSSIGPAHSPAVTWTSSNEPSGHRK